MIAFVSIQIVLEFVDAHKWRDYCQHIDRILPSTGVAGLPEVQVRKIFGQPTVESESGSDKVLIYRPGPFLYLFSRRAKIWIATKGQLQGSCVEYEPIYPLNDFLRTFGCTKFPQ